MSLRYRIIDGDRHRAVATNIYDNIEADMVYIILFVTSLQNGVTPAMAESRGLARMPVSTAMTILTYDVTTLLLMSFVATRLGNGGEMARAFTASGYARYCFTEEACHTRPESVIDGYNRHYDVVTLYVITMMAY